MLRKILIALAILVLLLIGAGLYVEHWSQQFLKQQAKARPEPGLIKGEGRFQKRVFYAADQLGNISQILMGWPADRESAASAVIGNKGAHFLDSTGQLKKETRFSKSVFCPIEVARLDATGDYAYLTRDESWSYPATLFDKDGHVSWSYAGGLLSSVDDSVSGDVYGSGQLSLIVAFNGIAGLALVDKEGKTVWKKRETNVWHVETLDTNQDGREKILHSNARGQLLVRDAKGDVIAAYLPGHYVSGFTVTRWGEEQRPTHILVPTTERQEASSNSVFVVLDASGKTIAHLESPLGDSLNRVKATPIHYAKGAEYFAVLQNNSAWDRSMLLLYAKDGQIAYQEILGESCLGIAALPGKDGEQLLIGCAGKIWEYSPAPKTNKARTTMAPKATQRIIDPPK